MKDKLLSNQKALRHLTGRGVILQDIQFNYIHIKQIKWHDEKKLTSANFFLNFFFTFLFYPDTHGATHFL